MAKIVKSYSTNDAIRYFDWPLTKYCNYSCSYCFADNTLDKTLASTQEWGLVIEALKGVKDRFNICLTGGEPIYHPNIKQIIAGLSKCRVNHIYLFTNFSHSINKYLNIAIDNPAVHIKISYHPEYDHKFKKDKLLELQRSNIKFEVRVMLHDKKYSRETKSLLDFMIANNIEWDFSTLRPTKQYYPIYTSKLKAIYKDYLNMKVDADLNPIDALHISYKDGSTDLVRLRDFTQNNFKGFKCEAKLFEISFDGKFTNACTKEETLNSGAICPNKLCNSDIKLEYTKELIDEP